MPDNNCIKAEFAHTNTHQSITAYTNSCFNSLLSRWIILSLILLTNMLLVQNMICCNELFKSKVKMSLSEPANNSSQLQLKTF